MDVFKLEKLADKFCENYHEKFPDIWWCFGNYDDTRVLFFTCKWAESEGAKPAYKMGSEGIISQL